MTRGAPGHDAISKTSKNVIFEVCDALKKNQVAKKHKSLRLILRPSPLNKLGFNHKIERSFGNMDKKVPRVMTRVIWVMGGS